MSVCPCVHPPGNLTIYLAGIIFFQSTQGILKKFYRKVGHHNVHVRKGIFIIIGGLERVIIQLVKTLFIAQLLLNAQGVLLKSTGKMHNSILII